MFREIWTLAWNRRSGQQKPEGVWEENWLPINRKDKEIGAIMRIYVPDLEKMKTWPPPKAEMVK